MKTNRRKFVVQAGLITAGLSSFGIAGCKSKNETEDGPKENAYMRNNIFFKISLAE